MNFTDWIQPLLFVAAAYFLVAAMVRRFRLRWGVGGGASLTISRKGIEYSKYKHSKPRMGVVTCLGFAMFFGAIGAGGMQKSIFYPYGVALGAVIVGFGAISDWLREPPKFTK